MPRRLGFAVPLLLALAPAVLRAEAPEPSSPEACIASASAPAQSVPDEAAPAVEPAVARRAPILYEPLFAASECCTSKQEVECRKQCNAFGCFPRNLCDSDGSCLCLCRCPV